MSNHPSELFHIPILSVSLFLCAGYLLTTASARIVFEPRFLLFFCRRMTSIMPCLVNADSSSAPLPSIGSRSSSYSALLKAVPISHFYSSAFSNFAKCSLHLSTCSVVSYIRSFFIPAHFCMAIPRLNFSKNSLFTHS